MRRALGLSQTTSVTQVTRISPKASAGIISQGDDSMKR